MAGTITMIRIERYAYIFGILAPLALLALLASLCIASPGAAQEEGAEGQGEADEDGEAAPVVTPPRLIEFIEADYPAEAEAEELTATVELAITIAVDGTVTDVAVTRGAGHGFDEAAMAAAERFRFEPARRDGEPMAARIRYRYVFELLDTTPDEPPPDEVPADLRPGRLSGVILTAEDSEPVGSAEVVIASEDGAVNRRVVVGPDGTFRFDDLPPGTYSVSIFADEFGEQHDEETVGAGEATEVTYRVAGIAGNTAEFSATANIEAPPREVVRRTITRDELVSVAGTRGDALRTVELLPGVGRPPFASGQLIVRGSAPGDSQVFLDSAPVPLLYHFGGLTSFYNSRLLEQIDFYPGNFSARYGRAIGGILEVSTRDPATDRFHGVADINLIDASVMVEAPLGDNVSFAVSARRSYIDAWFESVIPRDAFDVVSAPVYYDYQATVAWRPSPQDRIRFNVYGSSDQLNLIFSQPPSDPNIRGDFNLQTQFHRGFVGWERKLTPNVDQEIQFAAGPTDLLATLGTDLGFDATFIQMNGRAEWRARLSERVRVIGGLDMDIVPFDIAYRGPGVGQSEGSGPGDTCGSFSCQDNLSIASSGTVFRPSGYVETDLRPIEPVQVILGLRLDYYGEIDRWAFDPRAVTVFTLSETQRVKAAVGVFSQPPAFQESNVELGNPNLLPLHALHTDVGWEWDLYRGMRVGAEAFYKYLWDRPVATFGGTGAGFTNEGIGRIYGLELSGRVQPIGRQWYGFLSYTLSRSERLDGPDQEWRLFDYDQTHILSMAGVYRFGRGWEAGATFRLISGNPTTPIDEGVYDTVTGIARALPG
ncbi:MAG: TonB-dependent receptor, partial [Deltaproteobacteria bacterium]|nr:TonB-dependent receptor [Deltaproteobacteria bacterium]